MKYWISQTLNKKIAFALASHLIFITVVYLLSTYFFQDLLLPDFNNLIVWDVKWYHSIKDFGYVFIPGAQCNMAFFPLFPLLWDFLRLDALEISIFNGILFSFSFLLLIGHQKANMFYILAMVSLPSFIFFFVPYSESLFFLFGTIFLLGYNSSNKWAIVIGLIGACLTRSVAIIFIPALVIVHFLHNNWSYKKILVLGLFIAGPLASMLIVVLTQGLKTGKWFYFMEVQKYWNRHFHFPVLPFDTLSPSRILEFDAIALLIGLIAAYFSIEWIILRIKGYYYNITNSVTVPPIVAFSALYLAGVTFAQLFFSFELDKGTILMSLNRYVFATPFFITFINWLFTNTYFPRRVLFIVLGITLFTFFATALWTQSILAICYYFFFAFFFPIAGLTIVRFKAAYVMIYIVHIILQINLYNGLLHEKWLG